LRYALSQLVLTLPIFPAIMPGSNNPRPDGVPLHNMDITVRWGDMDALGHVNNIMYFRFFETVRLAWFEQLGYAPLGEGDEGIVIVDNHAEYLEPVVYPAELQVRMGGHSPGRSSFVSTYTITVGDKLTTRGSSRIVWVNNREMKSMPLPEKILQLLGSEKS